jgi:hypothetical protein
MVWVMILFYSLGLYNQSSLYPAREMQSRNIPLITIVILTVVTPLAYSGASFAHLDDFELWKGSNTVVLGTVTSITNEWGGYFYAEVEVERYLKNPSEDSSIDIHYFNRTAHNEWLASEGATRFSVRSTDVNFEFKVGERVYVFLRRVTTGHYEIFGGSQGKYTVVDGLGVGDGGRRISFHSPLSQTAILRTGLGIAVFVPIWSKRDWLSERIVGVNNG